ncbi:hypothetical protein EDB84DRAFT_1562581 [Lactarius hengduanensis]|nr:hypothetical protein EDB84DRAFT_1562581 [Lactarius hengduanensis]
MEAMTVVWTSRPSHNAGITRRHNRKSDATSTAVRSFTPPIQVLAASPRHWPARSATVKGIVPSCLNLKAIGLPARDAGIVPGTSCLLPTQPPSHPLAKCTVADLKAIAHDAGVAPRAVRPPPLPVEATHPSPSNRRPPAVVRFIFVHEQETSQAPQGDLFLVHLLRRTAAAAPDTGISNEATAILRLRDACKRRHKLRKETYSSYIYKAHRRGGLEVTAILRLRDACKRRRKLRKETYSSYIYKVLKQAHRRRGPRHWYFQRGHGHPAASGRLQEASQAPQGDLFLVHLQGAQTGAPAPRPPTPVFPTRPRPS